MEELLGRKESVDLRTVWPHELDFSGWLARNIEILSEQVQWEFDNDTVKQEVTRGSLRVDLLVDATLPGAEERFPVVIENQLDTTDGSHLAGVMAYIAAFEAKGAVWIAGDISQEYVSVMQWLNDKTEIDAYLFKIEAIRIDTSRPAPVLTKIVGPAWFPHTGRAGGDPTRNQQVRDWWGRALPELSAVHASWRSVRPIAQQWISVPIPSAPSGLSWYVNVVAHHSTVGVKIGPGTKPELDYYFEQLAVRKHSIDKAFGEPLIWDPKISGRNIWVHWVNSVAGGLADDTEVQIEAAVSIAEAMTRLVAATESIASNIPEFRPQDDDGTAAEQRVS